MGIPDEIEDAALIDGAGRAASLLVHLLPQVRGTLTVVGLTIHRNGPDFIFHCSCFAESGEADADARR